MGNEEAAAKDLVEIWADGGCSAATPAPAAGACDAEGRRQREGTVGRRTGDHQQPHGTDRRDPRPGRR